ncbi:MAG: B12-binding domain-containing radical SAM protein [Deltaproteobacteria bacterium]|jgi:radical SAM superfamily enzyme YgiQ (UPF0313 family)|nr:B12-binding domain-containing radical SAM protein [Deltaproteobacteria bacterium]
MTRPQILLVNPWIHDFAAYDLWARPMGLLVIGSGLRRLGWDPLFVDCLDTDHPDAKPARVKPFSQGRFVRTPIQKPLPLANIARTYSRYGLDPVVIERDLRSAPRPSAILVTSLMTYWYPGVREAIGLLRKVFEGVPILLGGIYASLLPNHALHHCVPHEVLSGPAEAVLAQALYRHTGINPMPQKKSTKFEFSPTLDLMRKVRFLPLMTSRGCPLNCSYCASGKIFHFFVRRKVFDVIEEIQAARNRYGINDIALYDDAFLVDAPRHALPILDAAGDRLPGMRWHSPNGLHATCIDARVASAMKRAGFETIRIGFESSSDEFHSRTGGKTDRNTFLSAVRNLVEAGFAGTQIGVYLLVGLPGQTRDQIEDDVDVVLEAGAVPRLAEYSPIPGTEMWPEAVRNSPYPIETEPLFHNCTLLPAAQTEVDWAFLQKTRRQISEHLVLTPRQHIDK